MSYIEVLIPLLSGIYLLSSGDKLIKSNDSSSEQKKGLLKKAGFALIGVSIIYVAIKLSGQ